MSKSITAEGNRLRYEKSPYLLQHTQDPVDWWSWCPGAFREAKKEDSRLIYSVSQITFRVLASCSSWENIPRLSFPST